jgi:hypothetical protein
MNELPTIPLVDSAIKFNNIIYDDDETRKKGKIMAYLIQTGLINSNAEKSQKDVRKAKASELEHFLMKIDSNSGKY